MAEFQKALKKFAEKDRKALQGFPEGIAQTQHTKRALQKAEGLYRYLERMGDAKALELAGDVAQDKEASYLTDVPPKILDWTTPRLARARTVSPV